MMMVFRVKAMNDGRNVQDDGITAEVAERYIEKLEHLCDMLGIPLFHEEHAPECISVNGLLSNDESPEVVMEKLNASVQKILRIIEEKQECGMSEEYEKAPGKEECCGMCSGCGKHLTAEIEPQNDTGENIESAIDYAMEKIKIAARNMTTPSLFGVNGKFVENAVRELLDAVPVRRIPYFLCRELEIHGFWNALRLIDLELAKEAGRKGAASA